MIDLSAPLAGLDRASTAINKIGERIAKADDPSSGALDLVDLSADAVGLMSARNSFESNLKVIQTADQVTKSLLDILA